MNNINTSNDDSSNNQLESTSVKIEKYYREEIQAIYDKTITDDGLVHTRVFDKTKVIN